MRSRVRAPNMVDADGGAMLPESIEVCGLTYRRETTFKQNWISAVGLYRADESRVVLKLYGTGPAGVALGFAGRLMAAYEAAVLRQVQDIRGIPRLLGRYGRRGLVREFVPGRPLTRDSEVDERFFPRLFRMLRRLHRRGVAYVDLEKAENILLGQDGRPYLIDFQIAFRVPDRLLGQACFVRWLRRQLQLADLYHARKHFRRIESDRLTEKQIQYLRRKPWFVRLSNAVHSPFKQLRRRIQGRR